MNSPAVSASDFVRRFATYARHASEEPVMIAQHGRVVLSLVSAAFLEQCIDEGAPQHPDETAKLDIVFDTIPTLVILCDMGSKIVRVNAATRRYFGVGEDSATNQPFTTLVKGPNGHLVQTAIDRVLATGTMEELMIEAVKYPGRVLRTHIVPFPGGIGIFSDDVTEATRVRRDHAAYASLISALESADVVVGRVNARGVVTKVRPTIEAMTNTLRDRIVGLRLTSLFEARFRVAIGELLEETFERAQEGSIEANLLTAGNPLPVKCALAPIHDVESGAGAVFVLRTLSK